MLNLAAELLAVFCHVMVLSGVEVHLFRVMGMARFETSSKNCW